MTHTPNQILFIYVAFLIFIGAASETTNTGNTTGEPPTPRFHEESDVVNEVHKSVPYFQASLPMRVFECLREFSILRCTKLFVLQKMEERKQQQHQDHPDNMGNLTRDFLEQFVDSEDTYMESLVHNKYSNMSDDKLNQCLVTNFQSFFKHRDIKLHFLPGIMVKIVPSRDNKLSFTLKKSKKSTIQQTPFGSGRSVKFSTEGDENVGLATNIDTALTKQTELAGDNDIASDGGSNKAGGSGKRKKKGSSYSSYKSTILQMAVPVMIMPAILMGTILPFLLPLLKLATILTMLLNNSAFMAALIYAARTHANQQEEQHISYGHQGYF